MAKVINVDLDHEGNFTVDLTGFNGKGCGDIVKAFGQLGNVSKEVHKREYGDNTKTQNVQTSGR